MVSACVWWRCAPIRSMVRRGARAPASLQDPPRHPVIIQQLKRSLVQTCRYLIAMTACVRRTELQKIVFFTASLYPYSYSLPAGATGTSIKMPKRLGKIKPPILGWETQLAKETTTSLFNETHWNSLLSRATQRDDLLNQTPTIFQNNTKMTISITSLTWLCSLCCWDISRWIFLIMRRWGSDFEVKSFSLLLTVQYFAIMNSNELQWFVNILWWERSITHNIFKSCQRYYISLWN